MGLSGRQALVSLNLRDVTVQGWFEIVTEND